MSLKLQQEIQLVQASDLSQTKIQINEQTRLINLTVDKHE